MSTVEDKTMNKQFTQEFMLNIVRQISILDLDAMREINQEARQSQRQWDAVGAILDPTRYRDMLHNGSRDHASLQAEVVDHLIAIRVLVDRMNAIAEKSVGARPIGLHRQQAGE